MKRLAIVFMLFAAISLHAQDSENIVVPRSMLTPEQLSKATKGDLKTNVHEWAGLGKEVGEAVNSSLSAITEQANAFAKTGVGKLTVVLVVWKVIGDQFVHIVFGILELLIFLPIWLWSYRRTCMDRRIKIGKDQWQVVPYQPTEASDVPSVRTTHIMLLIFLLGVVLTTIFSY